MDAWHRLAALERARLGHAEALGELLHSFRPYVRALAQGLANGRLPARVDDSDLIQDALLEAHRSFPSFRGTTVAEFVVWLRQVVLRSTGHTLRAQGGTAMRDPTREAPAEVLANLAADSKDSPSAEAVRREQASQLAEALARLPDDMQQVLLGRYLDDLPYAVLAERLGRTEAAVRVLYTRALRRLREEMTR